MQNEKGIRMRELAVRAGLPRTTIHYYRRIGLLHAPRKRAANSALYDESHVDRLRLIVELRSAVRGTLPVFHIRKILWMVSEGVPLDRAVAVQRAVLGAGTEEPPEEISPSQMTEITGLSRQQIRGLQVAGLVTRLPGESFDRDDVEVIEAIQRFVALGVGIDELERIARQVREISYCEMQIASRLTSGRPAAEKADIFLGLQHAANVFHRYLFLRARQADIQALNQDDKERSHA